MLEQFRCVEIDGIDRLHADYEINCWTASHSTWSYLIALPTLIVWGLFAPFLCFAIMSKLYRDKSLNHFRTHMGWLTNGLKDKYYYWEILIIYRKITLLLISAFGGSLGKATQGLIFFIIILVELLATIRFRPYSRQTFANLECVSLMVTLLTVYFGIFFVSDMTQFEDETRVIQYGWSSSIPAKNFFFVLILFSNIGFIAYWLLLIIQEIRAKLRIEHEKLYFLICACKNKRRMENEKAL